MGWLNKIAQKAQYMGQCDRLRMNNKENEEKWQQMIQNAIPVTLHQFLRYVDVSDFIDEDGSVEEFIADDPSSGFYISKWGDKDCWFIKTKGFEFIWI